MATRSSGEVSMTTRKTRPDGLGASAGAAAGVSVIWIPSLRSRPTERKMSDPAGEERAHDGDHAVGKGVTMGELEDVGADADLGDDERRRLGAHHLAIAHQQHLDQVAARRHIGGKMEVDAEKLAAEEAYLVGFRPIQALAQLDVDEGIQHGTVDGLIRLIGGADAEIEHADAISLGHLRREELIERAAGGHGI